MEARQLTDHHYTKQEYLDFIESCEYKYEFLDGSLRMMAGAKAAHNRIRRNSFLALARKTEDCEVYDSDTAISVYLLNKIYFPDLSAVCGEAEDEEGGIERLRNPSLIIEVLSKKTATIDRGEKFQAYWKLPSLKEYILIDSLSMLVQSYYRETEELWRIGNYTQPEQEMEVLSLGVTVPLAVVYDGVVFPEVTGEFTD
ncbi:Uma2 family endonuclease [Neolewinella sp.]|uniref:Uma2 family endonuclease n=1 Tax=Neolewinella sp. TaxID=2993543 RepID=UPI003B51E4B1